MFRPAPKKTEHGRGRWLNATVEDRCLYRNFEPVMDAQGVFSIFFSFLQSVVYSLLRGREGQEEVGQTSVCEGWVGV